MKTKSLRFLIPSALTTLAIGLSISSAQANAPYGGTSIAIPATIQAENYDLGGPGDSYVDHTAGNTGGAFRNDNVDVEAASTGGFNVGWFEPGEWVEYSINVASAGTYNITANIASMAGGGTMRYDFYGATSVSTSNVSFGDTGGWQNWQNTPSTSVWLNAGQHVVRVNQISGGFNFNHFTFTKVGGGSTQSPYFGSAFAIPGTVDVANYDMGGQGVAFNDTSAGNTGGVYRSDAVDIEPASIGGYNVGWTAPGEWLEYSLNVTSAGTYTISSRMASDAAGGAINFNFSGATTVNSANISVGNTGGWQTWSASTTTNVNLNAGQHIVRMNIVSGEMNIARFHLAKVTAPTPTPTPPPAGPGLPTAYPGYTGVYSGYTLKLDERFDGFNTNIWAKGDGAVGGESICRFQPQGVQVVSGNLELVIRNEYIPGSYSNDHKAMKGNYNFSCGELRTVPSKRIKFGRIETRMKAPARAQASGYISSLFTYRHEGNPREWEEIDVELEGGRPDKFQANLIYGLNAADWSQTRNWGAWEHKIDIAPADAWRVYAIEWTPSVIKWYVDGVLVKTLDQNWLNCAPCKAPQVHATPIPNDLTELMMNFWIPNDGIQDAFGGNKYRNVYPMKTHYDWVRIYQLNSHPLTNW